ncbi:MAG: FkbM family methyltransferase [Bacteroidota bacterium]
MSDSTFQYFKKRFNLLKFNVKLWLAGLYFTLRGNKYKTEGVELLIPAEVTDIKFRGQFPINFYEKQERLYLKQYLNPEATVLELGACLGVVSCVTNKLLTHPQQHVVVEANPNLIRFIERNKEHNGSGFQVENCMVSNRKSNTFFIGRTILMSSNRRASATEITVPGKTVTELEQIHGLHFDTLVMDIEGGELEFLRSNKDWLLQLHTIFMEVHPHKDILTAAEVSECKEILEEAGLKLILDDANFWILKRS